MEWIIKTSDWITNIISQNIPTITALLGVCIGAWLTKCQNVTQRKLDFIEKQVRELYSPLVGMRKEVQILSEFRCASEEAQKKWWQSICQTTSAEVINKEGEKISSQIAYSNKQLTDKIIPAYRQMVNIIKNNYWLAEEETTEQYPILVKFVEAWERHLSKTHPAAVINSIQVKEDELFIFYTRNEEILQSKREKIKSGHTGSQ